MTTSDRPEGYCRICGTYCVLSEEHVPPRKAFNDGEYIALETDFSLYDPFEQDVKGQVVQGGLSGFTLCTKCNNDTGGWYARAFIEWTKFGMKVLQMSGNNPKLIYLHDIFPLRVLKQIMAMTFSMNGGSFRDKNPELVKFVLNKEEKWLNPRYRTFVYFNINGVPRRVGNNLTVMDLRRGEAQVVTEISHPPFGYVVTTDGSQPHNKLTAEITHFRRHDYQQRVTAPLYLPVLDTYMPIPLDYRTVDEIMVDRAKGLAAKARMAS